MMEFFSILDKEDQKKILEKACSYNTTEKDYGEKSYNPVTVGDFEYNNLKDDFEKLSEAFTKNPIFNKYPESHKYIEILDILKNNEDFNTDQTDCIIIKKHNYSIMFKNINEDREYPGTTLSICIDTIIEKCEYKKYELDENTKNMSMNIVLGSFIIGCLSLSVYGIIKNRA